MTVKLTHWTPTDGDRKINRFLGRQPFDAQAEALARKVLAEIAAGGDKALIKYIREFEGYRAIPATLRITRKELSAARSVVDQAFQHAARKAHRRIAAFARTGMKRDWQAPTPGGGFLGEQFKPIERVGVYVPGGAAPLASTVLMTVTLAKVAGVREIVMCTPGGRDGRVNPALLFAAELAGATEIYRIGGIQAIGALACGTETVRRVHKIVGPGGAFVTAAKRQVYGRVALDLVAGPSEVVILADDTADPRFVAADLLSQAEHGTGNEKALLVTTSRRLARAVQTELDSQVSGLGRAAAARVVMRRGMLIAVTRNLDEGMDLCNRIAPEHFEIMTRHARQRAREVRNAGAIFIGTWSPESAGDFAAGPSHVLPTGGTATMFSGLTVDDFRKRSSLIAYTRSDLRQALPIIEAFANVEGLDAHGRSAGIRFEGRCP